MNDDEFSGIVRSGTSHSVSVSEHTGNAKTPKNIVTSHPEETEAKKVAFETKEDLDLHLQQLVNEMDASKQVRPPQADKIHVNIQAAGIDPQTANTQTIGHDALQDNHQKLEGGSQLATNHQTLIGQTSGGPNVQGVLVNTLTDNVQAIPNETLQDNHQELESSNQLAPNRQALTSQASNGPNVQGIPVDTLADNVQTIANDALQDNHQKLGSDHVAANLQALGGEAADGLNMQGIANDAHHAHDATFGKPSTPDNSQTLPNQAGMPNHQDIPTLSVDDNLQAADEGGMVGNNRQTLAASPELETNRQTIDTPVADLNRQAAPEDLPTPANRQAVDSEHLQDHLEALPSTAVERAKVDFPTSPEKKPAQRPPTAGTNRNAKSKPAAMPSPRANAPTRTAAQLSEHEKFLEAFHGRLAGIKHDVDQINDRLDVFEQKK